jgi:hypothetical protein
MKLKVPYGAQWLSDQTSFRQIPNFLTLVRDKNTGKGNCRSKVTQESYEDRWDLL